MPKKTGDKKRTLNEEYQTTIGCRSQTRNRFNNFYLSNRHRIKSVVPGKLQQDLFLNILLDGWEELPDYLKTKVIGATVARMLKERILNDESEESEESENSEADA